MVALKPSHDSLLGWGPGMRAGLGAPFSSGGARLSQILVMAPNGRSRGLAGLTAVGVSGRQMPAAHRYRIVTI